VDAVAFARTLDGMLVEGEGARFRPKPEQVYNRLSFWLEYDTTSDRPGIRLCEKAEGPDLTGFVIVTTPPLIGGAAQIVVPLNPMLKGYQDIRCRHTLYCHSFQTDVPLAYFGITSKPWFVRLREHIGSANAGSPYLFHDAIRRYRDVQILHRVFLCDLDVEDAYESEEDFVGKFSLYPLGLNMIPGGKAGLAYLARLGFPARSPQEKAELTEMLSAREQVEGRPNPLCAARWAADQSFVERVICGHSGRLTVEQVRTIRLLSSFGKSIEDIQDMLTVTNTRQVRNVLRSKTYQRIK
jgi:hypothetical protein